MNEREVIKVVNLGNLFTSIATLILAFVIYKQFGYQQVQSKQIEAVSQLVEYIHENPIQIVVQTKNNTNTIHPMIINCTLFELCDNDLIPDSLNVYCREGEMFPFEFRPYVCNPLIPLEIADVLSSFYSHGIKWKDEGHMNKTEYIWISNLKSVEEKVIINSKGVETISDKTLQNRKKQYDTPQSKKQFKRCYSMIYAPAYKDWGSFVSYSKQLKNMIKKWYKEQGINNINIREYDYMYAIH